VYYSNYIHYVGMREVNKSIVIEKVAIQMANHLFFVIYHPFSSLVSSSFEALL